MPISWDVNGQPDRLINLMKDFPEITESQLIAATGVRFDCTFDANNECHDFTIVDSQDDENKFRVMKVMISDNG